MEIIAIIAIWIGVIFCGLGAVGLVRFDNIYNRLHAGGLISTLGLGALSVGAAILMPSAIPKLIILGIFIVITSPVVTQAISLAAHRS